MKNTELKQISVTTIERDDKARHYTVIVHYKNATREYVTKLMKKQFGISVYVIFKSKFNPVDQYNTYPADTILDSNW